ncbi:unnamed protein product [Notodromas monacha]|uniref:Uncharacterized protein n=1 Tax=Notodromas monacha TaxID=399045 RepID=A0A7R9GKT8_9CRUS|nr:unnamed protein product [Notodromas monacha]CAG0924987.1 unnamed protein product [Notodromas monacha]
MRELEDLELAVKVLIVGNGAVGKSSMIQRYCRGTFTKDYKKTIGVDFLERCIELEFPTWFNFSAFYPEAQRDLVSESFCIYY